MLRWVKNQIHLLVGNRHTPDRLALAMQEPSPARALEQRRSPEIPSAPCFSGHFVRPHVREFIKLPAWLRPRSRRIRAPGPKTFRPGLLLP